MSEITTAARPYAKAAFDFAIENQCVDKWQNMLSFIAVVTRNQHIGELITGLIAPEKLAKTLITICGDAIDNNVQNLIRIMAENRRLSTLQEVCKQFKKLRTFLESRINIDVISAIDLNEKQQFKIAQAMEKRLSCQVKLHCKIDKSIIAGVIIYAEDFVIDSSVRTRIENLSNILYS
ncbi:MAG: F0F1 ATP synthase subunit delta [Candidatus Arsenophonus melophagi]|nr:F0F1 ATP synthase subunit delta [Candidatus Arsenophonus melophagi]